MSTAKEYRAKATKYRGLLDGPRSPAESSEFRNLEQSYTILADNEEWLALNVDKIVRASDCDLAPTPGDHQHQRVVRVEHDGRILRCLTTWAV